jgi:Tat protein secretion system quality control protein TatD with DNase activity
MRDCELAEKRTNRRTFLKVVAAGMAGATVAEAKEASRLEFADSHGHVNTEFAAEWVDVLAARMGSENVTKASLTGVGLLSDHEDTDVLRGYEKYPRLFLPFLCNFDPNDPKSFEYVRHQLDNGPWRGVGELYLDTTNTVYANIPLRDGSVRKHPYPVPREKADSPVFRQVFDLCGEKGLPVFIHCERLSFLCEALARHGETQFLAAHCDYRCRPDEVRRMLEEHSNVCCDVGAVLRQGRHKNPADLEAVELFSAWQELLADFPERICLGTDTYSWKALEAGFYRRVYEIFHELTAHLSREDAHRVAKGNFERLTESRAARQKPAPEANAV